MNRAAEATPQAPKLQVQPLQVRLAVMALERLALMAGMVEEAAAVAVAVASSAPT